MERLFCSEVTCARKCNLHTVLGKGSSSSAAAAAAAYKSNHSQLRPQSVRLDCFAVSRTHDFCTHALII
jgi:hypothetical protein